MKVESRNIVLYIHVIVFNDDDDDDDVGGGGGYDDGCGFLCVLLNCIITDFHADDDNYYDGDDDYDAVDNNVDYNSIRSS